MFLYSFFSRTVHFPHDQLFKQQDQLGGNGDCVVWASWIVADDVSVLSIHMHPFLVMSHIACEQAFGREREKLVEERCVTCKE